MDSTTVTRTVLESLANLFGLECFDAGGIDRSFIECLFCTHRTSLHLYKKHWHSEPNYYGLMCDDCEQSRLGKDNMTLEALESIAAIHGRLFIYVKHKPPDVCIYGGCDISVDYCGYCYGEKRMHGVCKTHKEKEIGWTTILEIK